MKLKINAILDPGFQPLSLVCREFKAKTEKNGKDIVIGVERNNGYISVYKTRILPEVPENDEENYRFVERIAKSMLWVRGGYKIILAGSDKIGERLKADYKKGGAREFDSDFMARVYERPFEVEIRPIEKAPVRFEETSPVGRHLDGCRIGFDAGGSDRKVSAVINGEPVYSEEVVWFPKINSDPNYHYEGIVNAFKTAASKMPRVDAIGVSSAGIYVDNRIMVASLFLKVSDEDFDKKVKNMYIEAAKEIGDVPLTVANDGDVTALAGAMDLDDTNVLGVAMGTSEAVGFVDQDGNITGWLNELAFVPVDYNKDAMVDEWSGDYGCGVKYFSQDSVIKLAPAAGIELDEKLSPAEKLKVVQKLMAEGDERAAQIYDTIG
ncbi:MAG: ROK family protein, partial [Clostridia bacterium]|nr:ROK family protein [Clostridia bacterium]